MPKQGPKRGGKSGAAKPTGRRPEFSPELESRLLADLKFAEDLPFDDAKQRHFLSAYLKTASLARARDLSGTTHAQLQRERKENQVFDRCVREIEEHHTQTLEDSAFLRACHGWLEPVFQGGRKVGEKRKYSNGLTIFLLKARRPEVYNAESRTGQQAPEEHARRIIELTKAAHAQFDDVADDASMGDASEASEDT
jgi:hypothetical protein